MVCVTMYEVKKIKKQVPYNTINTLFFYKVKTVRIENIEGNISMRHLKKRVYL